MGGDGDGCLDLAGLTVCGWASVCLSVWSEKRREEKRREWTLVYLTVTVAVQVVLVVAVEDTCLVLSCLVCHVSGWTRPDSSEYIYACL